jgi:ERCC4-type nuclease
VSRLFIDPREGSDTLIGPLTDRGLPVTVEYIDADVAFTGRGEKGVPLEVGVEYKKLPDYLASMKGRLQGVQVPRMLKTYDRRYLIVEGEINYDAKGRILRRAGRNFWKPIPGQPPAAEILKKLIVMELRGGIYTIRTSNFRETLLWVECLYRVWTDKDLDEHKSHLAIYAPDIDARMTEELPWFVEAMSRLDGIGLSKAKALGKEFNNSMDDLLASSLHRISQTPVEDLRGGVKRLGKVAAKRIFEEIHR